MAIRHCNSSLTWFFFFAVSYLFICLFFFFFLFASLTSTTLEILPSCLLCKLITLVQLLQTNSQLVTKTSKGQRFSVMLSESHTTVFFWTSLVRFYLAIPQTSYIFTKTFNLLFSGRHQFDICGWPWLTSQYSFGVVCLTERSEGD